MIETRNGDTKTATTLKSGEWCFYTSENGTQYTVHNIRGKMLVFKRSSLKQVKPTKEIRNKIKIA